jgi:beta-lactamase regulating signal transducer with metallopeptidase domain
MIGDLTNHLWQSTMFAVVPGLLAAALRKNRAHVRYWLWFTASCKFFVPFSLLMSLGSHVGWTLTVKETAAPGVPAVSLAIERIAEPFYAVFPSATAPPQTAVDWARAVIPGVWVCGFAAIALTRLRGWRRIQAAVHTSTPLTIHGVGLQTSVQVRSSPGLLEPGVVGLWRPVLLVPAGIEEHLTPLQLGAVVAHELCHVRRRDNLTAAIHMIVEAVFWFHPLVWWIGARLVDERERACDEHVLRVFGDSQAYAEGILSICKLYVESPLACLPGVTGSNVKKRIEDIMINRVGLRLNVARKTALALAATVALATPIVAGMVTAPLRAQSQPRTLDPSAFIRTQETVLKYALFQMRDAIDQYYADKHQYPSGLDSLASEGYIRQIPTDPFTNRTDSWQPIRSEPALNNLAAAPGMYDVKSGSEATALDGTDYSDW